jgi:hypothetical protein
LRPLPRKALSPPGRIRWESARSSGQRTGQMSSY